MRVQKQINEPFKYIGAGDFFNWYLAAPRPTLVHSQWDSLTNPMLITPS